ncbi:anaerobic benzoate catabolism transcriptional regulator [bacterium YEK0313]|nr:anaerobic benzoate catabolism transcriptional regulator [bacterium YEK0313]
MNRNIKSSGPAAASDARADNGSPKVDAPTGPASKPMARQVRESSHLGRAPGRNASRLDVENVLATLRHLDRPMQEALAALNDRQPLTGARIRLSSRSLKDTSAARSKEPDAAVVSAESSTTNEGIGRLLSPMTQSWATAGGSASVTKPRPVASTAGMGRIIKDARVARGLSQQQFADLAGVGRRFLSELENGKATVEFGKVLAVAIAAGIDLFATKR